MTQIKFAITGINCMNCVNKITTTINNIKGVSNSYLNFAERTLELDLDENKLSQLDVINAIKKIGYNASIIKTKNTNLKNDTSYTLIIQAIISIVAGGIFMFNGMFTNKHSYFSAINLPHSLKIAECVIVLIILLSCGTHIFKSAWISAKTFSTNMYSLISLGIISAYVYSVASLFLSNTFPTLGNYSYFESALIIVGLVNIGAYIEQKANKSTLDAINALFDLVPPTATIIRDNKELTVKVDSLTINDIVKILPGEKIPCDGVIIDGKSYVDESMLSGESHNIEKTIGSSVIGGTINTTGSFNFKVTHIGDDTTLAKIIKLTKDAQKFKPKLAKIADTVATYFVPAVFIFGIISADIWYLISSGYGSNHPIVYAMTVFMSVLIIACPCSVGLAIPMSLMVGLSRAAKSGVLIQRADVIQHITQLDYILFDKTGTITSGKQSVVKVTPLNNFKLDELIIISKSLENKSEHPIATAILRYKTNEYTSFYPVQDFTSITGSGVSGVINGEEYHIGKISFITAKIKSSINFVLDSTNTVIYIANNTQVIGVIEIADAIKEDATNVVTALHQLGIKTAMLTGDNLNTATIISNRIGIQETYANLSPEDKSIIVKRLQNKGYSVAFVGDGINDAIALTNANVGIAMGHGTDVAIKSADIVLMGESLKEILHTINIAKAINKNMRQNLFGAFIYNGFALLVAAGILYPFMHMLLSPMVASIAMSLSSITVILNANSLRFLKIE